MKRLRPASVSIWISVAYLDAVSNAVLAVIVFMAAFLNVADPRSDARRGCRLASCIAAVPPSALRGVGRAGGASSSTSGCWSATQVMNGSEIGSPRMFQYTVRRMCKCASRVCGDDPSNHAPSGDVGKLSNRIEDYPKVPTVKSQRAV